MSKIKVNKIEDLAGSNAYEVSQSWSHRNIFINGCMRVWQRGESRGAGTWIMAADRWFLGGLASAHKVNGVNGGPNKYNLKGDINNTEDTLYIGQTVEEWKHLIGKTVTISFDLDVISAPISDGKIHIQQEGGAVLVSAPYDNKTSGKKTVTLTIPSEAVDWDNAGLWVAITLANNKYTEPYSGGEFNVYNTQLELGSLATPFEIRPLAYELSLCQRYFYRMEPMARFLHNISSGGFRKIFIPFPVTMRKTPTVSEIVKTGTSSKPITVQSISEQGVLFRADNVASGEYSDLTSANINAEF